MRTTITTVVPALAAALALGPALGAAERGDPSDDQSEPMAGVNAESVRTLDQTGRLLIVDLGDEPMNGDNRIHFDEVWEDRSLEGDVPQNVRYIVVCDPKDDVARRTTVRDAFEDSGYYQVTWFYVDDPAVIERAREGTAAAGATSGDGDERTTEGREAKDGEHGDSDIGGAAARDRDGDAKPPGVVGHAHGAQGDDGSGKTSRKAHDGAKGQSDARREGGADAKPPGQVDRARGAAGAEQPGKTSDKSRNQGKGHGASGDHGGARDDDDVEAPSPTAPRTPDQPKDAE